ncbi:hypothetical protein [Natrialba asiatica]|nr:hypothetical protein [Natrialba asiatica]
MTHNRRQVIGAAAIGMGTFAGCTNLDPSASDPNSSSSPNSPIMSVSDTRVAHKEGKVGVFVTLQEEAPDEAGSVKVRANLFDGEGVPFKERIKEFDVGGNSEANVSIWFEDLTDEEKEKVDGAKAEAVA